MKDEMTREEWVTSWWPADCRTVIELGVAEAEFTDTLASWFLEVWGVDRWNDGTSHDTQEYLRAHRRLFHRSVKLLRCAFEEALELFEDEYFDLVYVDGYAHTGQEEGQTLEDWWPKVRKGGVMAMHDYDAEAWPKAFQAWNRWERRRHDVVEVGDVEDRGVNRYPTVWARKVAP